MIPLGPPTPGTYAPPGSPHCEFTPPVINPDQYLPNCVIPPGPPTPGTYAPPGSPHCEFTPPVVNPDQYLPNCVIPAGTPTSGAGSCSFPPSDPVDNPNQYFSAGCVGPILGGVDGAIALVKSTDCHAIGYSGAGGTGKALGALVTNGGLAFAGLGNPKHVKSLGSNRAGCGSFPPFSPSGTSACTSTAWSDPADSDNVCVRNLVDISSLTLFPRDWSITPPTVPSVVNQISTKWNAVTDYPTKCHVLSSDTVDAAWAADPNNPPGIYCYTGAGTLMLSGDLSAGDGYTFFTTPPNRAKIQIASNSKAFKFYWPSGCGPRPTTRPASFKCFVGTPDERTISGYDPQTLLYSSNLANSNSNCSHSAICLDGNTNSLSGDIFAPEPLNTPADDSTSRAGVFVSGSALSAGNGFIETWWLNVQGNFGSYLGTGENIGGHQSAGTQHCEFPPGTVFPPGKSADDYLNTTPDRCTIPGAAPVPGTVVSGSAEHCEFPPGTVFPPGKSADDYLNTTPDRCTIPGDSPPPGNLVSASTEHCEFPPGTVFPPGKSADDYLNTTPDRCTIPGDSPVTGAITTAVTSVDYGMDE